MKRIFMIFVVFFLCLPLFGASVHRDDYVQWYDGEWEVIITEKITRYKSDVFNLHSFAGRWCKAEVLLILENIELRNVCIRYEDYIKYDVGDKLLVTKAVMQDGNWILLKYERIY